MPARVRCAAGSARSPGHGSRRADAHETSRTVAPRAPSDLPAHPSDSVAARRPHTVDHRRQRSRPANQQTRRRTTERTRAARIPWTLAFGGSSAAAVPPASAAPNHPNEPERRGFFQVRIRSFCDGGSGRGGGGPEKSKPTRAARISRIWMPAYGRPFCAGGSLAAPGAGNSERTRATDSTGSSMSYGSRQQAPAGWSPSVEAAASRSLATGGRLRAQLGEAS